MGLARCCRAGSTGNRLGPSRSELESAWVGFASRYHWAWFVTLTTDPSRTRWKEENTLKAADLWMRQLERLGRRRVKAAIRRLEYSESEQLHYSRECAPYAMGCMEWTESGYPHLHLVVGGVVGVDRDEAETLWNELAGFAAVRQFDPLKGGGRYCWKYVAKGGEAVLLNAETMILRAQASGASTPTALASLFN